MSQPFDCCIWIHSGISGVPSSQDLFLSMDSRWKVEPAVSNDCIQNSSSTLIHQLAQACHFLSPSLITHVDCCVYHGAWVLCCCDWFLRRHSLLQQRPSGMFPHFLSQVDCCFGSRLVLLIDALLLMTQTQKRHLWLPMLIFRRHSLEINTEKRSTNWPLSI